MHRAPRGGPGRGPLGVGALADVVRLPEGMTAVEADYSRREAKLGLGSVLFALPDVLWVNRPDLAARAVYKPLRYSVAARAGLMVPPALVTNSAPRCSGSRRRWPV